MLCVKHKWQVISQYLDAKIRDTGLHGGRVETRCRTRHHQVQPPRQSAGSASNGVIQPFAALDPINTLDTYIPKVDSNGGTTVYGAGRRFYRADAAEET